MSRLLVDIPSIGPAVFTLAFRPELTLDHDLLNSSQADWVRIINQECDLVSECLQIQCDIQGLARINGDRTRLSALVDLDRGRVDWFAEDSVGGKTTLNSASKEQLKHLDGTLIGLAQTQLARLREITLAGFHVRVKATTSAIRLALQSVEQAIQQNIISQTSFVNTRAIAEAGSPLPFQPTPQMA